jgi:hypothetical protein
MMINEDDCGALNGIIGGETEVLGKTLTQCSFVHLKFNLTSTGLETGQPRWEAGD